MAVGAAVSVDPLSKSAAAEKAALRERSAELKAKTMKQLIDKKILKPQL